MDQGLPPENETDPDFDFEMDQRNLNDYAKKELIRLIEESGILTEEAKKEALEKLEK